jgi:hypothetical protein
VGRFTLEERKLATIAGACAVSAKLFAAADEGWFLGFVLLLCDASQTALSVFQVAAFKGILFRSFVSSVPVFHG